MSLRWGKKKNPNDSDHSTFSQDDSGVRKPRSDSLSGDKVILEPSISSPISFVPKKANVVIIGGGIAGAMTALLLRQQGVDDVIVLEQVSLVHLNWKRNGIFS